MSHQVIITIEGGCVQSVSTDDPDLDLVVLDFDLDDVEHPGAKQIGAELCQFIVPPVSAVTPEEQRWLQAPLRNHEEDA